MTKAHDFRVVNVSGFKSHGDHILAAFMVRIAALKWSKARADEFADTLRERHPDLIAYEYQYERIPDESRRFPRIGEIQHIQDALLAHTSQRRL